MKVKLLLDTICANGNGSWILRAGTEVVLHSTTQNFALCVWQGHTFATSFGNIEELKD